VTTHEFVGASLPAAPARVLEIGCGPTGELAAALAADGLDVLAIDPVAPAGLLFRRVRLEELGVEEGPFDGVVAVRSLHHLHDLEAAMERVASLLRPGGVFVVVEFAWDLADEPTLAWRRRRQPARDGAPPGGLLAEWVAAHRGLHGDEALRGALESRFATRSFERGPDLYHELGADTRAAEAAAIEAGAIRAIGFRWVGVPR
jgi:SAM-dependent methyltransferase